ncbi:chemotaxis protein [Shewanella psychrotolerans]|uniref:chemotaxis protein n=1 Tax=Shewanella psychrotolerans TaxID=2864206 RepID=UPI001C65F8EC|nr:chemotaxis protein [Shewanella psychrotolerans]QYK02960.1 chemotaxis protein [Shewanella psychrotolerans]
MTQKAPHINQYHVIAAVVAAELNHTLSYCKQINLTASNAQATSARIGNAALGFKALTGFIDDLACYTMKAATDINALAHQASLLATKKTRTSAALKHFQLAQQKAKHAKYATTINAAVKTAQLNHIEQTQRFRHLITKMETQLVELKRNLRTANILASICRIEACRVDVTNQTIFNDVANRVDNLASLIRQRVDYAITLFNDSDDSAN